MTDTSSDAPNASYEPRNHSSVLNPIEVMTTMFYRFIQIMTIFVGLGLSTVAEAYEVNCTTPVDATKTL